MSNVRHRRMQRRALVLRGRLVVCMAAALWAASMYLAHLSGRAMNDTVGSTVESQDLEVLSAAIGLLAVSMFTAILAAQQTGSFLVRLVKLGFTFSVGFAFQTVASFLLQHLSSP